MIQYTAADSETQSRLASPNCSRKTNQIPRTAPAKAIKFEVGLSTPSVYLVCVYLGFSPGEHLYVSDIVWGQSQKAVTHNSSSRWRHATPQGSATSLLCCHSLMNHFSGTLLSLSSASYLYRFRLREENCLLLYCRCSETWHLGLFEPPSWRLKSCSNDCARVRNSSRSD